MHRQRLTLLLVNVLGGAAVLGSYAWGLATYPEQRGAVWGGVPDGLKPLYTVGMLLAAAGYFPFTSYVLFGLDPARVRVGDRRGYGAFTALYLAVLVPSALWMPLTLEMIAAPSTALWVGIRVVLAVVGVAALLLYPAIASARPSGPAWWRRLALVGVLAFAFQTAVLDALVWPAFWPR